MAAAPVAAGIPGASGVADATTMAYNAYNKALTQINQNRLNTLTNYGYTGSVDPTTGIVNGVRVDPNSVTGQLQQLLHQHAIEDRNAQFSAEDHGLFGGLANQALSENRFTHQAQDTALGNNLQNELATFQTQQQQAADTRDNTIWQAEQAAAEQALQAQYNQTISDLLNNTPVGGSSDTGGSGDSTPTTFYVDPQGGDMMDASSMAKGLVPAAVARKAPQRAAAEVVRRLLANRI